jgi:hypothetical protein
METTTGNEQTDARLHPTVRDLIERHLGSLDQATKGLVEGMYLTGSIALGDYHHGVSDIDFLAVTSRPLGEQELAAVSAIHAGTPPTPHLDGVYLDHTALSTLPDNSQAVPHAVHGMFYPNNRPCGELNPVLWLTLAHYGIAVRGPRPADLSLRVDPGRLREWNLDNLKTYWQPLAGNVRHAVAGRTPDAVAAAEGVVWAALGPARLHHTLATNDVISKSAAGHYAIQHFPQWASLTERAVNWREGHTVEFVTTDALAVADMVEAIVDDAWRRWA